MLVMLRRLSVVLSVVLTLALTLGGWSHGIGTGGGGGGTPVAGVYYLAPGGSDGNDGQTPANAWASPNHPLNCGDVVHMQAGSYNPLNFAAGKWGTVANCPSTTTGSYFASLVCDGPFVQDCSLTGSGGNVVQVTASNWLVKHLFATANYANGRCFTAGDAVTLYHHIAFVDVYAKNCGAGVLADKVDYVAYVGLLSYGGDVVGQCVTAYKQNHPVNLDSFSGTHNFTAAAFVLNTVSTAGCGEGLLLLQWDHLDDTAIVYTGQGAIEQSLAIGNGAWCVAPVAITAPVFIDHVSCWGNFRGTDRTANSEAGLFSTKNTTVSNGIFQATINQTAGSTGTPACATTNNGAVFAALYNSGTGGANVVKDSYIVGVGGLNECTLPGSVAPTRSNITNASPGFAGAQQISAAPDCSAAATVTSCIAGLRANFVPSGGAASLGYQPPTSCRPDPLWPNWLLVSDVPSGLVTTPCPGPVVAITTPAGGAPISGSLAVNALCLPACTQVTFQVDGAQFAIDTTSPYAGSFDTTTVANGPHTVSAVGVNASGTTTTTIGITVNNVAPSPTVAITAPANNATVSGSISITGTCALAGVNCTQVVYQMDGATFATTSAPFSTSFDTTTVANGAHTLAANGTTAGGGQGNASITLNVNNAVAAYTGPGDIAAAASPSFGYTHWYGVRAYSAATRGQKLMNVCVNNDAACADVFSSATTGDLVPATIGGITCPNQVGSCTIRTAYDLTQSTATTSPGLNATQLTIASRPLLVAKAVPILGVNRACIWYPDSPTKFLATAAVPGGAWGAFPMTMSAVAQSNITGTRGGNPASFPVIFGAPAGGFVNGGINWPNSPTLVFSPPNGLNQTNGVYVFSGDGRSVAFSQEAIPHAIQGMFGTGASAATSTAYVDGVLTTGLIGNANEPIDTGGVITLGGQDSGHRMVGLICEVGYASGNRSNSNAAINNNQLAYYTTPTTTYTPVLDFTLTFDGFAAGTRVDLPTQQLVFQSPNNNFNYWHNYNYNAAAGGPCPDPGKDTAGQGATCVLAPTASLQIVSGGNPNNAFQQTYPTGSSSNISPACCGLEGGVWIGQRLSIPGGANVIDLEWDQFIVPGFDLSTSADGKIGPTIYFVDPTSGRGAECTMQIEFFGSSVNVINLSDGGSPGGAVVEMQNGPQASGAKPQFQTGGWVHWRTQNAIGPNLPNSWCKVWLTPIGGTTPIPFDNYTRNGGTRPSYTSTTSARFDFNVHFGGVYAAANNSSVRFDNMRFRAYNVPGSPP